MRRMILFAIAFSGSNFCKAQSSTNLNVASTKAISNMHPQNFISKTSNLDIVELPTYGLFGIGNVNTETFQTLNSSGKLSGFIRPFKYKNSFSTFNFSFNVNASNNDSLLVSTFLFPDVGTSSFYINWDWSFLSTKISSNNDIYLFSPFFEFANKTIKGRLNDSTRRFSTLSYTFGTRLQYLFLDNSDQVSFSVSPFLSFINVPDEDNENYRYLFTRNENSVLKSVVSSWGLKFAFQYNQFQIFADLRHVMGGKSKIPVQELRGFNSNIGVVFNASIFEK